MKVQDIRYQNLLGLLTEAGGSQAELARRAGTNAAYINQIINQLPLPSGKVRGVGERLARNLEKAFNRPEGWMDTCTGRYHVAEPEATYKVESPQISRLVFAAKKLRANELELVCKMVEGLASKVKN